MYADNKPTNANTALAFKTEDGGTFETGGKTDAIFIFNLNNNFLKKNESSS